jgi:hypothetical protein
VEKLIVGKLDIEDGKKLMALKVDVDDFKNEL